MITKAKNSLAWARDPGRAVVSGAENMTEDQVWSSRLSRDQRYMESTDAELKKVFIYAFMCCNILEDTSCTAPFVCHMPNAPKHIGCGYYAIHPGMFIATRREDMENSLLHSYVLFDTSNL